MVRFVRVVAHAASTTIHHAAGFSKNLANSTTEDIELRLCLLAASRHSNVVLELLELYVQ